MVAINLAKSKKSDILSLEPLKTKNKMSTRNRNQTSTAAYVAIVIFYATLTFAGIFVSQIHFEKPNIPFAAFLIGIGLLIHHTKSHTFNWKNTLLIGILTGIGFVFVFLFSITHLLVF
jgi:K+-sensing histidine kinase KdpD